MSNPYLILANAEEGSPEHLQAVSDIQAMERAEAKAQENVIKGDGRSGHAYASYQIVPEDAVDGYENRTIGSMSVGEGFTDKGDVINIAGMECSRETAEGLRRTMSVDDWREATGLPYENLLLNPKLTSDTESAKKVERFMKDESNPLQQKLDEMNDLEKMIKENEDQHRQDTDNDLQSYEVSLVEKVLEQHYGSDITSNLQRAVIESGEIDNENLTKLGVNEDMMKEAVSHYVQVTERMLEPVGSCTAYLENFLSDAEAAKVRAAIVGRDMSEVQRLGMIARDRAANMSLKDISNFLSKDEKMKLRVRQQGSLIMVDLPGVGATSWGNAVTNGLISFKS